MNNNEEFPLNEEQLINIFLSERNSIRRGYYSSLMANCTKIIAYLTVFNVSLIVFTVLNPLYNMKIASFISLILLIILIIMVTVVFQKKTRNWETSDRLKCYGIDMINLAVIFRNLKGRKKIWEKYEELLNLNRYLQTGQNVSGLQYYLKDAIKNVLEGRDNVREKTTKKQEQKIKEFFNGLMNDSSSKKRGNRK